MPVDCVSGTQHITASRDVATCTHGRTCVPEKMLKKGNSGFICSTCAYKKRKHTKIISEFTGKNDRTLSLCLETTQ